MTRDEEKYTFELFLKLQNKNDKWELSESPDIILYDGLKKIGYELTEIINKTAKNTDYLPIKLYKYEDQIIKVLRKRFIHIFKTPVFVSIDFKKDLSLTSKLIAPIAEKIALATLNEYKKHEDNKIQWNLEVTENKPEEVNFISFDIMPGFDSTNWYVARFKTAQNITRKEIINRVREKEEKICDYRKKADIINLIIVEGLMPQSWFYNVEDDTYGIESLFNEIILLRKSKQQLIRIN